MARGCAFHSTPVVLLSERNYDIVQAGSPVLFILKPVARASSSAFVQWSERVCFMRRMVTLYRYNTRARYGIRVISSEGRFYQMVFYVQSDELTFSIDSCAACTRLDREGL